MQIKEIVELAGVLILVTVFLRAGLGIFSLAGYKLRAGRAQKKHISEFRKISLAANRKFEAEQERNRLAWEGKRKFRIAGRIVENPCGDVCSFYLVPYDDRELPKFQPGQFLTFELSVPGEADTVSRCYSISSSAAEQRYYRISVKRLDAPATAPTGTPPGLSSSRFHDHLQDGAVVDVRAPRGNFCLDMASEKPVILIAGGIGITPILSMLDWLYATGSQREIWVFYGVRNRNEHAMQDYLTALSDAMPNLRMLVAYSQPTPTCRRQVDYQIEGHITVDILSPVVGARDCEIYLCGPGAMMTSLTEGLAAIGVPKSCVRSEEFTPASSRATAAKASGSANPAETFSVTFARSGKVVQWAAGVGSLLEAAEANGVKARCGCRQGICGTCAVAVQNGDIDYMRDPDREPAAGTCLPCIARPRSDLVLDL
ncbi:MAG: 2Fe-2S iron-sulfur cluster-binding protein [Hyphomicrobiales bacterium]|nr:2Fe-2S iron-sulfur cluster-binding protein [Hyphomicrobiales bacterium]